ncbi:MAG: helix-hairpin-helix domain-containing protein [Anaerohalosphaera sp.]|nr:helix-hairpin-helix domain-containing protein [Anaerohalosphaera sp.]
MFNDAEYRQDDRRQRTLCRALGVSIIICAVICTVLLLSMPDRKSQPGQIVLSNTVNPNTASVESLVRLPGIGASRANSIVEYRQDGKIFNNASDLEIISGIGPATSAKIAPYLCFDKKITFRE